MKSLWVLLFLFASQPALADEDDELDSGHVVAVEGRPYRMVHEFTVSAGVLPIDALFVRSLRIGRMIAARRDVA